MDQKNLKELLHYDHETGVFTWTSGTHRRHKKGMVAGSKTVQGYIAIGILDKDYLAHRLAWLYVYGYLPPKIDHKNTVKTDNWIDNLREATTGQNSMNRHSQNGSFSKYKGVSWHKGARKWTVNIQVDDKQVYLGLFDADKEVEAAKAYNDAATKLHGKFARLNPI